ncbi:MAG: LptF/LptG family permease [Phycisphaeraceae bacterium]
MSIEGSNHRSTVYYGSDPFHQEVLRLAPLMLFTLYWYILKDLLKMLVISTVVLVIVISFGAAIKPLMDGLLSIETLPTFVMITAPTMLMYALPFSLAFSVTMVYTRMATDGEITACSAGGLSYSSVFKPVVVLGVAMMMGMYILSNWVLPSLHKVAREMVQKDTIRLMMNEFAKGRAMRVGDAMIYARDAQRSAPPTVEGSPIQPEELILLRHATIGKIDVKTGRLLSDHTASEADILVYRDEGRAWIQFRLRDPIYHAEGGEQEPAVGMQADRMEMLPTIELPSQLSDDPRRMSWNELMRVSSEVDRHPILRPQRTMLAGAIAIAKIRALMQAELDRAVLHYGEAPPDAPATGGLVLHGSREGETFVLSPPKHSVDGEALVLNSQPGKPVQIDYVEKGELVRRYEAAGRVTITLAQAEENAEPKLTLTMADVTVSDARQSVRTTEQTDLKLSRLWWRDPVLAPLTQLSGNELQTMAKSYPTSMWVLNGANYLRDHTDRMTRRAVLEFHLRGAYSFNLLLAALFAGVISVRLRGSLSLVVFFYTFMVVLAGILITYNGERFGRGQALPLGLAMLWLSSVLTAGGIGMIYSKVARN